MIEPTKMGLRIDSMGDGSYGAKRGNRIHKGIDFLCSPGMLIKAPISGNMIEWGPYKNDSSYHGIRIRNKSMTIKLFYCKAIEDFIGRYVEAGQSVAHAEDISKKHGGGMLPHVHLQIDSIDPMLILRASALALTF